MRPHGQYFLSRYVQSLIGPITLPGKGLESEKRRLGAGPFSTRPTVKRFDNVDISPDRSSRVRGSQHWKLSVFVFSHGPY